MTVKMQAFEQVKTTGQTAAVIAEAAGTNPSSTRKALDQLAVAGTVVKTSDAGTVTYKMPAEAKTRKASIKSTLIAALAINPGMTYDEGIALAKTVKPETSFDKRHWSWYRTKARQANA